MSPLIQHGKNTYVNPSAIAEAWFYEARKQWFFQLIGESENAVHEVEPKFQANFEANCLPKNR